MLFTLGDITCRGLSWPARLLLWKIQEVGDNVTVKPQNKSLMNNESWIVLFVSLSTAWIWWRGTPTATAPWRTLGRLTVRSAWTRWPSTAAPTSATHSWPRPTCRAATPTATTAAAAPGAPRSYDEAFRTLYDKQNPIWQSPDRPFWEPLPVVTLSHAHSPDNDQCREDCVSVWERSEVGNVVGSPSSDDASSAEHFGKWSRDWGQPMAAGVTLQGRHTSSHTAII